MPGFLPVHLSTFLVKAFLRITKEIQHDSRAPLLPNQEERNRKAIQRSLQAPRKKVGRPVMFRSRLQKRKVSKNKDLSHGEDLDEIKHLT